MQPTNPRSFKSIPNNTHRVWYRDPALRLNVFHCLGLCLVISYLAMPAWQSFFSFPTGNRLGLYAASFYIPSVPAAFLGDFIANRFGRRPAILLGSVVVIGGSLINGLAANVEMWVTGRATIGFGGAIVKVAAPALIAEIAHPRLRPMLAACYWSFFHFGAILAAFMTYSGLYISGNWSWKMPSILQVLGPGIVFVVACLAPESPRWLSRHDQEAKALAVLARYHANGVQNDELVSWEMDGIRETMAAEQSTERTRFRDFLKTSGNRHRLYVLLSLCWGLNWVGNGIISYGYLAPVLQSVGVNKPTDITLINAGLSIWNLCFSVGASINTERLGRRPSFFISLWGMLLSYGLIMGLSAGFAQTQRPALGVAVIPFLFIYYAFYSIAWTPLPIMYTTEILPFNLRTKGIALFTAFGTAGNAFNQFVNPIALGQLQWRYYGVYLGVISFYLVFAFFMYPETKGYTIEQIAVLFDRQVDAEAHIVPDRVETAVLPKKAETELVEEITEKTR